MTIYTVVLLRHAESAGNAGQIYQGQANYDLTERGELQVRKLIHRWRLDGTRFDHIIASPLKRATDTAEKISKAFHLPMTLDEVWQERDNGNLTGLTRMEANKGGASPAFYNPYQKIGDTGESDWDLFLRAGRAINQLLARAPGRYLIVSHGGLLNQALHVIFGIPPQANGQGIHFRFVNTAFATLYYQPLDHKWVVFGMNDYAHLALKASAVETAHDPDQP